jgi:hypothetical protein
MRSTFIVQYNPSAKTFVAGSSFFVIAKRTLIVWRLLLAACSAVLFAVALSNRAYELTSPSTLPWHVLLRKAYSIGAFAVIGFLIARSRLRGFRGGGSIAALVGLYSAAIEVGQYLTGVREGLLSNAFDVVCGLIGGALGSIFSSIRPLRARVGPGRRRS